MVFRGAGHEFELKIKKIETADLIWRMIMQKVTWLGCNSLIGNFGIANYETELKIQKFTFADSIWRNKIAKSYLIGIKLGTSGFLASLIRNPSLTFRNSKCQMQYGWPKFKKQKVTPRRFLCDFFGSLIMNLTRFLKSIWRTQDGAPGNLYSKVSCVADYEFDLWFSYLEIADPFQLLKRSIIIGSGGNAVCERLVLTD